MLKLARKKYQSIIVNCNTKVTVICDKHNQVRHGNEAPDDVEIWCDEICERIAENRN